MFKKKNIVIGVTALTLVLSSGAIAFASTGTTNDQIGKGRSTIMSSLTDSQREAVQQARVNSMTESITELVDKGIITQTEAEQLTERKSNLKESNGMTALSDEQRTALHEEEKAVFESQLAALIKDGTITQSQADQMEQGHKMMESANLNDDQKAAVVQAKTIAMKQAAANLVEKGTLTQDEANAISEMTLKGRADGINAANILTDEQKTTLSETIKANLESKLTALVKDNTITQSQAEQLLSDKDGLHMGFGGRHRHDSSERPSSDDQTTETQDTAI